MLPTRLSRAKAYQPMIKFLGSRKNVEYAPHAPAPHPAAPQEIVDTFQSFLAKLQSTGGADNPPSQPKGQSQAEGARGKVKLDQATGPGQTGDGKGGQGQALQSNAIETTSGSNGSSGNNGDSGSSGVGASGKGKGSGTGGSGDGEWKGLPVDFENYWEAPEHLWRPREVSKRELEAVMSGGATDIRTGP